MKKLLFIFGFMLFGLTAFAQTVYSSEKGEKYHTADCKLSGDANPISVVDAKKKKKAACGVCKPDEWVKQKLNQCAGKTKDGTRCKRMTANKSKKCFQHGS